MGINSRLQHTVKVAHLDPSLLKNNYWISKAVYTSLIKDWCAWPVIITQDSSLGQDDLVCMEIKATTPPPMGITISSQWDPVLATSQINHSYCYLFPESRCAGYCENTGAEPIPGCLSISVMYLINFLSQELPLAWNFVDPSALPETFFHFWCPVQDLFFSLAHSQFFFHCGICSC